MKKLIVILMPLLIAGCAAQGSGGSILDVLAEGIGGQQALSETEIADGLREALTIGTQHVIEQVGAVDGFNLDPDIHIPLPRSLQRVDDALSKLGLSRLMDNLETRLNRAAEVAAPQAKALFIDAISNMTLNDARQILTGPDDAATQYFRTQTSEQLSELIRPVVESSLRKVGALQAYDSMISRYKTLPFVPDVSADLTRYTIDRSMDGIFYYLAREEAAIRHEPIKRTTALLRKVFGQG